MADATSSDLRTRQQAAVRTAILQAASDEIAENGTEGLSLRTIAQRAGVSKRTLYNYFDSRETLFTEICAWSNELTLEMGGSLVPQGLDTLPEVIPAVWKTWQAQGTVYQAAGAIVAATNDATVANERKTRRTALIQAVSDVRPDLSAAQASDLAVLFHALASGPVFHRMTVEDELPVERSSELISWVVTLMRDAIANGDTPFDHQTQGGKDDNHQHNK